MSILQNEWFRCDHLGDSERDREDVRDFTTKAGRGDYLQNRAFADEEAGVMRTYMVRERQTMELAGYFSLKAGFVSFKLKC